MDDSARNMSREQVKSLATGGAAELFHAGLGRVALRASLGAVLALIAFDALAQQQFLNRGRRGADVTVDPSVIEDLGPQRTLQQLLLPDYTRQSTAPVRLRPPAPATTASRQPAANTARPPANRPTTAAAAPRTIAPQTAQPAPTPESSGQRPPQTAALPTLRPPVQTPDTSGLRPPAPDTSAPRPAAPLATLQPPPAPQRPPVASAPPALPPAAAPPASPPPVTNAPRPAPGATAPPPPPAITSSPPAPIPPRAPVTAQAAPPVAPPPLPPVAAAPPPASAAATPPAARPAAPSPNLAALPPAGAAAPTARVDFNLNSAELSEAGKSVIATIADQLMKDDNLRLQLVAYATGGESVAEARRLSLSRALTVRSLLIDKGVRSTRLDVKALGTKADDGPSDRVDLVLVKR